MSPINNILSSSMSTIIDEAEAIATPITLPQRRLKELPNPQQKQRQLKRQGSNTITTVSFGVTQMSKRSKFLLTFLLLGLFVAVTNAVEEKTVKSSQTASPSSTLSSNIISRRDEIYIDDEGIEGSGGRGELNEDLEKDPDYSGSGFGPDDEDSSTDHHTHSRPQGKQDTDITDQFERTHQTNTGTSVGSGVNSGSNTGTSSGSGNSGSTSINTIGNDHSSTSTSSSSSTTTTTTTSSSTPTNTTTTTTNNHNSNQNTISSSTSSINPPNQTYYSQFPSQPQNPLIHTDDDDFDLDETIDGAGSSRGGSGDGGIIDNDDDDHTGDDDEDGTIDQDILHGSHHHNLGTPAVAPGIINHKQNTDEDITKADDDNIHSDYDDNDDDADNDNDNDNDNEDENEGSEIYTEVTDPNTKGDGNGNGNGNIDSDSGISAHKPGINNQGTIELDTNNNINSLPPDTKVIEHTTGNEVLIMNTSEEDRTTSFFAQPGILAAVIGGAVVGLLCAILVVMFIVYRMRKKDEGSYALDEPKRSPAVNSYAKNANNREFYA